MPGPLLQEGMAAQKLWVQPSTESLMYGNGRKAIECTPGGCMPFKVIPLARGQVSSLFQKGLQDSAIVDTLGCQDPYRVTL